MAPRSESFSTKSAENTVRDTKISDSDTINNGIDKSTTCIIEYPNGIKLFKYIIPTHYLWMPKWLRYVCGWILICIFILAFMIS